MNPSRFAFELNFQAEYTMLHVHASPNLCSVFIIMWEKDIERKNKFEIQQRSRLGRSCKFVKDDDELL